MSNTDNKKIISKKVKELEEFYNNGKYVVIKNKNLSEIEKENILNSFEESLEILKKKV